MLSFSTRGPQIKVGLSYVTDEVGGSW